MARAGAEDLVVAHGAQLWLDAAGGEPGRVEQVRDQCLQSVGAFLDRGQLGGGVVGGQLQFGVAEAAGGGLDGGQGCAQVVADRGEQGAAQLGGLRSSLRLVRFGGQPLGPQGEQRLAGDPAQDVLLGGGQERGRTAPGAGRWSTAMSTSARFGCVDPGGAGRGDLAPAVSVSRSSSATEVEPNASRTFSSSRRSGSGSVMIVAANSVSRAASVRARTACWPRRAASCTTSATNTAASSNKISESRCWGSTTAKLCSGG